MAMVSIIYSFIVAMINSVKGYGYVYGLKGWELNPACAKEDLVSGIRSTSKSLLKIPNLNSAVYLYLYLAGTAIMVATFAVKNILEVINILLSPAASSGTGTGTGTPGKAAIVLYSRLFRLAKFFLWAVVMFTLKDASDRDRGRLEGTTFIEN